MLRASNRTAIEIQEEGRALALVPLGPRSERVATIWNDDYVLLMSLGLSSNWLALNSGNYVYTSTKHGQIIIARVLLDAKPGQIVRYLDSDPMNLKRENLVLMYRDIAKKRDRELVMAQYV